MKRLHLIPIFLMALFSVILFSCSKEEVNNVPDDPAIVYEVNIQNGIFNPDTLYALPGKVINWKNLDAVVHTVTSDDGITFSSGNINPGGTYTFSTSNTSIYPYHCDLHPNEKGVLSIVIR